MTASMLGLGAIRAASAFLLSALRWLGGAYLIYLGVALWRAPVSPAGLESAPASSPLRMFAHAYAVTALNPKGIIFFVAFVPQFLQPARSLLPQMAVLISTFVTMATLNALLFAFIASAARRERKQPRVQRAVNRTGGSLLVGAGLFAAGWRASK